MRYLISIIIVLVIIGCGKEEEGAPPEAPPATKFVYCTQEEGYKLCEVRIESGISVFDQYTNTVLFGTVDEFNRMLQNNGSQTRLRP